MRSVCWLTGIGLCELQKGPWGAAPRPLTLVTTHLMLISPRSRMILVLQRLENSDLESMVATGQTTVSWVGVAGKLPTGTGKSQSLLQPCATLQLPTCAEPLLLAAKL